MSRNDTGWQNSRVKTKLVPACIKNGKRTAASKRITLLYQWEKKPRKTAEEMNGQWKWRYGSKEIDCTTSNGSGVGQKEMETSSSSLIIIDYSRVISDSGTNMAEWPDVIVGRFTDETNVFIKGKMGVQSDAKNYDVVRQRDWATSDICRAQRIVSGMLTCAKQYHVWLVWVQSRSIETEPWL